MITRMMDLTRTGSFAIQAIVLVCLLASSQIVHSEQQGPTRTSNATLVQTSSGLLRGIETQPAHSGYQSVVKFLAVPYAQAPIGQLRFKRPVELPVEQSSQLLDATKLGKTCPQHKHLTRFISPLLNLDKAHQISEDCLQLNVFVPSSSTSSSLYNSGHQDQNKLLPVIVWIPGEGFDFADARQFDASQLALKTQSIVITVQYRVGAFGLLDAPEHGIDGNQAIHDQLMALRWVQRNVRAFGGNRNQVTVMGRFTGAMSISAMLTAPNQDLVLKQDAQTALFNRAILTSGIAVDDWIIVDNQQAKFDQLVEDARTGGLCYNETSPIACLQSIPMEQLLELSSFGWRLVKDDQLISRKGGPIEALRDGKTSKLAQGVEAVLLGETGAEGTLCLFRHMLMANVNERARLIDENQLTNEHFNELIRDDLATYYRYNTSNSNQALELTLNALVDTPAPSSEYQSPNQNNNQLRQKYLDACASFMVKTHNQRFKRHLQQVQANSNFQLNHYQLKYKPSFSLAPDYIETAAHGDDVPLIFGLVYDQPADKINQDDLIMTQKMLAYIGNFVHGRQMSDDNEQAQHVFDITDDDNEQGSSQTEIEQTSGAGHKQAASSKSGKRQVSNEQQPQQQQQVAKLIIVESPLISNEQIQQQRSLGGYLTRSQKLLELHRQQILDEGLWLQRRAQLFAGPTTTTTTTGNGQQRASQSAQDGPGQLSAATETSLATVLLLTASIVILALMSVCVVLSVMIVRYNAMNSCQDVGISPMGAGKRQRQFNSSSSCNICDDSQGGSIDAVLNQQASAKKNEHAFCNVFAKLRNHHQQANAQQQQNQTTTTVRAQTGVGELAQAPGCDRGGQHKVESVPQ